MKKLLEMEKFNYSKQSSGKLILIALFFMLFSGFMPGGWSGPKETQAATCTATAGGNWNTAGTWTDCGHVPTAIDNAVISAGQTVVMNGNFGVANSLIVNGIANWTGAFTTNIGIGGEKINAGGDISGAVAGNLKTT